MIKKLEEEKSKAHSDNETAQIKIDKFEAKIHKLSDDLDRKTREFTLMENLKDQFERDNKNLYSKNKKFEDDIRTYQAKTKEYEKKNNDLGR